MIKLIDATEEISATHAHSRDLKQRFRRASSGDLAPSELIELLMLYATRRPNVKPVTEALEKSFRGLRGIFEARIDELTKVPGVSEDTALLVKLIKELAGEYLKERMVGRDVVSSTRDVLDYLTMAFSGERVEKFLAIYLNSRNEALAVEVLHEGTINQTMVYPRKAIEKAFLHNAHAIIFVHNHPSGDATPSNVDRQLAYVLDRAVQAVGLVVHDHMIIGRNCHFSARESGWF